MAEISPSSPVITLNVNELNSPIKRQKLAEGIKQQNKTGSTICGQQETHVRYKDTKAC